MTNLYANASWENVALNFNTDKLLGGWNDFEIRSAKAYQTCYWVLDYYRFETVLPSAFGYPPKPGLSVFIR